MLHLSRHTVDFHLRQIFRKLNLDSRVELAWSVANGQALDTGLPRVSKMSADVTYHARNYAKVWCRRTGRTGHARKHVHSSVVAKAVSYRQPIEGKMMPPLRLEFRAPLSSRCGGRPMSPMRHPGSVPSGGGGGRGGRPIRTTLHHKALNDVMAVSSSLEQWSRTVAFGARLFGTRWTGDRQPLGGADIRAPRARARRGSRAAGEDRISSGRAGGSLARRRPIEPGLGSSPPAIAPAQR